MLSDVPSSPWMKSAPRAAVLPRKYRYLRKRPQHVLSPDGSRSRLVGVLVSSWLSPHPHGAGIAATAGLLSRSIPPIDAVALCGARRAPPVMLPKVVDCPILSGVAGRAEG